jgi:RHS repeat-associated protein
VDQTKSEVTGNYTYSSYNSLNQLKSATRIESEDGKNAKTYSYSYRYDKKGNQVEAIDGKAGTTTSYEYDVENQLIHVRIDKNGTKVSEEYNEYNGAGQRIKKNDIIVTDSGKEETETICYYYEGSLLLYTTDENGVKTSQNIIGNQNNAFATIRYDGNKQREHFYSKDVQGSVTNLVDNTGICSKSYNYTDFGETEERFESEVDNEICYTGGVYDDLTGLYYLNARYYNSDDGNFLSQDSYRGTEGNADSWNLYAYCAGNPVNYVDPSGHAKSNVNNGRYYPAEAWVSVREYEAKKYTYYNLGKARKYIYDYLRKKLKANKKQACAILGNIYVETWHTYSSWILQGSSTPNPSYINSYDAYDSKGWGILQWTYFSRKEKLKKYVKKSNKKHATKGLNVGDLIVQLEFFNKERKGDYKNAWKKFKSKKSLDELVNSFCTDFEQAGVPHLDERKKEAKKCMKRYK